MELVELLQKIHQENPCYGTLRILVELRDTYKLNITRKRVSRLLRKYGLNAKTKHRIVKATDSSYDFAVCDSMMMEPADTTVKALEAACMNRRFRR